MAKKARVVEITRNRWADATRMDKEKETRGSKFSVGLYLPENKTMCCLGFVCRALGNTVDKISGVGLPSDVDFDAPEWLTDVEERAAEINDDSTLTRKDREASLKRLFEAKTPIRLKFVP